MRRAALLVVLVVSSGCGSDETEGELPAPTCAEHELALPDGRCLRPGVPLDGCGEGFVHDGVYGCEPILPSAPCPPGQLAVPGDETCRAIMDCGTGKWGNLPLDGSTQHVDGSYSDSDADGSEARPWPTIDEAVAAAAPGALIAVAAGTYTGGVLIQGKPVRLWGLCPERVTIEATSAAVGPCPPSAVCILEDASETEVGGVALRGAGTGVILSGSENVVVDRVHAHDNTRYGIAIQSTFGPTSLHLLGSLLEQNHEFGLFVMGASATVDATAVRTTQPLGASQAFGRGIQVQLFCSDTPTGDECDAARPSTISVTRSLIEENHEVGLFVMGSSATVDGSVVRNTFPNAQQEGGLGVTLRLSCVETPDGPLCDPAARSTGTVSRSLIEQHYEGGLSAVGSDLSVEATVVRHSLPGVVSQRGGLGIDFQPECWATYPGLACDPATGGTGSVSRSLIEHSHEVGLRIMGANVAVDATVVRATAPSFYEGAEVFGDGLAVASQTVAGSATLSNLLVADSARAGIASFGALISLVDSHIRCAGVDLNGERFDDQDFEVTDLGDNRCGCPTAEGSCKLVSAGLAPPDALPMGE